MKSLCSGYVASCGHTMFFIFNGSKKETDGHPAGRKSFLQVWSYLSFTVESPILLLNTTNGGWKGFIALEWEQVFF